MTSRNALPQALVLLALLGFPGRCPRALAQPEPSSLPAPAEEATAARKEPSPSRAPATRAAALIQQESRPIATPTARRTAAPARATWPAAIGPFTLKSGDGKSSITPGLTVQLRLQVDSKDPGGDSGRELGVLAEARRIRPTLAGSLFTEDLRYYFHLSTAPGSLEFMDFYLDYAFHPMIQARVGQGKIPFTRHRTGSYKDLSFADWAINTRFFGAERQLGLTLHNGYEKAPALEYEVGIFSGQNARASHGVGLADLFGEKTENPSDLAHPGARAELHPELVAHLAWSTPGMQTLALADLDGGPLRLSAGLSMAWDLDPQPTLEPSLRVAPELMLKIRGFALSGIFYLSFARRGDRVTNQRLGLLGGLVQASTCLGRRLEFAGRYALVDADSGLLQAAGERAAGLIAAATDDLVRKTLSSQYKNAGKIEREQEASFAINLFLLGRSLKWQNDVSWLIHSRIDERRTDVRFRSQVQLAF